jgi:serine/threonine-protein phosphatase 5
MALCKFKEALKDLKMVTKYAPHDPDAKTKYAEVEKTVRRMEFERALAYEEQQKSVIDTMDLSMISVEPSYDGMRWDGDDDEPLTLEFVMDLVERFEKQKRIHRRYLGKLLKRAKQIFVERQTLVHVKLPASGGRLTVCGDVHGQFYDFLNIFRTNGFPSTKHAYLFNGDFVDRGSFSVEIVITLLAFLCLYPDNMHFSRGNHETDDMNRMYGFEGEMKHKYSEMFFRAFSELFCCMPLCNVIENRVFVVHGGLFTRDDVTLEEIGRIDRFKQPSSEGLMCEMLWADPMPRPGRAFSKRGVGLQFGPDVTENFLRLNNLDLLIRSHEVKDGGYVIEHNGKCVTVFSAPNYWYVVIYFTRKLLTNES